MKKNTLILLAVVIVTVINIIFYHQLPDKIGLQISSSGELRNYIPKLFFIIIVPVIIILDYLYTLFYEEANLTKAYLVAVILILANIITIFMNI